MRMQSDLSTAQTESSTGQYADISLQLGAQAGEEISLQNENGLLQTLTTTNSSVTTRLTATTTALDTMRTDAQNALDSLTQWTQGRIRGARPPIARPGQPAVAHGTLNTSVAGEYIFGGINSGTPPIADYFAPPAAAQSSIQSAFFKLSDQRRRDRLDGDRGANADCF